MAAAPDSSSGLKFKLGLIAAVVVISLWKCLPLDEKLTLGLDLQGGTHMVLQVHLEEAVRSNGERTAEEMKASLREAGVAFDSAVQTKPGAITIAGIAAESREKADEALARFAGAWEPTFSSGGVTLELRDAVRSEIRTAAARQVRDTIERRVNEFGLTEPQITSSGEEGERIVLQLPGVDDLDRVKGIITKAAVMEFRLGKGSGATREALVADLGGTVPPDIDLLQGDAAPGRQGTVWYAVERTPVARGEDLVDARPQNDEFGKPCIGFSLSGEAGERFGAFTGQHLKEPLAVVLDGRVVQYAIINSTIFANGVITGAYSVDEAHDAALRLKSGSLPAKVSIEFEQTVGPWLGRDSIAAGRSAILVGFVAVVIFMLVWYKGAGVNAVVALLLNVVLILAALAWMGATLTLPGMAGIVLTIGMAVDANVIIFERIKEEMAAGRTPAAAMDGGFRKAFSSILDSNLTTVFAALFLMNYGTGPIKGFAVTLMIGLACSMFTAIYVSRVMFDVLFALRPGLKQLSIQWVPFRAPSIRFLRLAPLAGTVSVLAVLASIYFWGTKGLNYSIDFKGGTQVAVRTADDLDDEGLRRRLAGTDFANVPIQEYGDPADHQFLLRVLDAESAVGTATVNSGGGAASDQQGSAERLVAALAAADATGGLDLNSAGRAAVRETLQEVGGISPSEADNAAAAILEYRKNAGGLLASVADVRALPGVSTAAADWLERNASAGKLAVISSESVGPAIGAELKTKARGAVLWSLAAILAYMWFRFELRFGVAAIVAVAHDVMVTVGLLALLGKEFDLNIIAALLTLVGYSLNDTIITFDRVRENLRGSMRGERLETVLDASMNQTLSRSVLTSFTVFLAVIALLVLGGPVLNGFAFSMTVGVVVGTYSSIYIANPLLVVWERVSALVRGREAAAA